MTDRLQGLNLAGLFELALEGGDGGSPVAGGSGEDPTPGGEPEQTSLLVGSDGPLKPRPKILRGGQVGQVEALVETRDHFRRRLLVGTVFILLGVGVFLARDLLLTPPPTQVWQRLAVIGVAATAGAGLYWRPSASWRQLRLTEIVLFWTTALWFAADRYHYTWSAAIREDAPGVLFAIAFAVLFYFALTVGYGIVVPNTWWRALRVTALTAAMPFAIVGLLYLRAPAAFDFVRRTMSLVQLTSLGLMLAIGFGLAAVGTHRLRFLREAAVAAR